MKTMNYIIVFGFLLLLASCGGGGWSAEDKEGLKSMLGWVNEEQYDCYAEEAQKKFDMLAKKGIDKFLKKPIKNKIAKDWIKKQKILTKQGIK